MTYRDFAPATADTNWGRLAADTNWGRTGRDTNWGRGFAGAR